MLVALRGHGAWGHIRAVRGVRAWVTSCCWEPQCLLLSVVTELGVWTRARGPTRSHTSSTKKDINHHHRTLSVISTVLPIIILVVCDVLITLIRIIFSRPIFLITFMILIIIIIVSSSFATMLNIGPPPPAPWIVCSTAVAVSEHGLPRR